MSINTPFVHPTAFVDDKVNFGENVKIWHFCHIRSGACLGDLVSIGKDSYVDANVTIGRGSRVQNQVSIYTGVHIGQWCFVGPSVVFTNDQNPRVGNKTWQITETHVENGASIGAGSILRCGITIGAFSMIGAGSIVTKNVAPFTLAVGLPAGETKKICACGITTLDLDSKPDQFIRDCCLKNMSEETLNLAREELVKLLKI
jgi:UDP-2-acetamido-3-amino-2,3-dideoxy-glucuronate N-acetyltransferase